MSTFPRPLTALLIAGPLGALLACPSRPPSPTTPVGAASGSEGAPMAASASSSASAAPSASSSDEPPSLDKLRGAVKEPVFSADACKQDSDCVAVATCHAKECVLPAHVGTFQKGMLCTMDCRGGTIDCGFNHCGCASPADGGSMRCALLPGGPKKP